MFGVDLSQVRQIISPSVHDPDPSIHLDLLSQLGSTGKDLLHTTLPLKCLCSQYALYCSIEDGTYAKSRYRWMDGQMRWVVEGPKLLARCESTLLLQYLVALACMHAWRCLSKMHKSIKRSNVCSYLIQRDHVTIWITLRNIRMCLLTNVCLADLQMQPFGYTTKARQKQYRSHNFFRQSHCFVIWGLTIAGLARPQRMMTLIEMNCRQMINVRNETYT